MKARIEGLDRGPRLVGQLRLGMEPDERDRLRPALPGGRAPRRADPSGDRPRTLYVNRIFTQRIVGLDPDESDELLDHLYQQAGFPEYQCRWQWRPGDVAFWDNRSTQHYAVSDYHPQRRVMERITVCGDRPR